MRVGSVKFGYYFQHPTAAVFAREALRPLELPELRGAEPRHSVLLRPGRDSARLAAGFAGALVPRSAIDPMMA